MLTATASGADGADFEKNGRVIIYAQFWRQLLLTMGQVRTREGPSCLLADVYLYLATLIEQRAVSSDHKILLLFAWSQNNHDL